MSNDELLEEFEKKFKVIKKELGFKSSLKELDDIFFLRDFVLREGYVSESLSRSVCHRIIDLFLNWNNYLHGIIMPNPQYLPNISESEIFSNEEKENVIKLISRIMDLSSKNSIIGLSKDNKGEAKFIDESVDFWKKTLNPELSKILKKANNYWVGRGK